MKRGLLWSMILAILASPTWASRTLHPGVQVGFAWTNLNYDDPDPFGFWDAQWDNGFTVGAFVDIQIIGPLSVVPELQFVRYQNKVEVDTGPGTPRITGDFQIEQDYVSFPLLVKWKPVPLAAMDFFVAGGVELGFLTSAKVKMNLVTQPGNLTDNTKGDIKDTLENLNISLLIGAGVDIHAAGHIVVLQVRYHHGLTGTAVDERWITDWKTQAVEFVTGFGW